MDQIKLDACCGARADRDGLAFRRDLRQLLGIAEVDLLVPVVGDNTIDSGSKIGEGDRLRAQPLRLRNLRAGLRAGDGVEEDGFDFSRSDVFSS